ncbi:CREB-regulated transcription coactivator 3 [Liparis tanakae]|uniref:CREB-regulated transcription coactivator 3 n=1 Tax=Liparis tanakae TaxID=230148 RepID=A0A4Z2G1W2_9TELE|nr:CREB-regulated transcription coactivator 3 [Liparis tanakae]
MSVISFLSLSLKGPAAMDRGKTSWVEIIITTQQAEQEVTHSPEEPSASVQGAGALVFFIFLLFSVPHRTNSDSALHTSAMTQNPQDPFGLNQQMGRGPPQRNVEGNTTALRRSLPVFTRGYPGNARLPLAAPVVTRVFSFPAMTTEENLLGVSKPLPKQLWEAKKVQSLASRPKSCEVPGINLFYCPLVARSITARVWCGALQVSGVLVLRVWLCVGALVLTQSQFTEVDPVQIHILGAREEPEHGTDPGNLWGRVLEGDDQNQNQQEA